jgi:hypothetical protein
VVLQTAAADVDVGDIESRITKFLNEGQLPVVQVDCPGPVEAKQGEYTSGPSTKGNGNATSVP